MSWKSAVLSTLLCLTACFEPRPLGFFVVEDSNWIQMVPEQENPFQVPQSGGRAVELLLHMTQFHPMDVAFTYESLAFGSEKPLTPTFFPAGKKNQFRVVFSEPLPPGGVLNLSFTHKETLVWQGFIGDHRESALAVFQNELLTPDRKLVILRQFNQSYRDRRPLLSEVAILESRFEDLIYLQVRGLEDRQEREEALAAYLQRFPGGKHVPSAVAELERLRLIVEDEAFARVLELEYGEEKVLALARLSKMVSGWNRAQVQRELALAHLDLDHLAFDSARPLKGWQGKETLQRYLVNFPKGVNRPEARKLLEAIDRTLEGPFLQRAAAQKDLQTKVERLEDYLEKFPNGRLREDALRQLGAAKTARAEAELRKAISLKGRNRQQALARFLVGENPEPLLERARVALAQTEARLERSAFENSLAKREPKARRKALIGYLLDYPNGRHFEAGRGYLLRLDAPLESGLFQRALGFESPVKRRHALRDYLELFPRGEFRDLALEHLNPLEAVQNTQGGVR